MVVCQSLRGCCFGLQSRSTFFVRFLRKDPHLHTELWYAEGERDLPPLPQGITPHSLRRTFASVLYALGEDPGVVMDERATPILRSRCGSTARRCGAGRMRRSGFGCS